jgi:ABC-type glycerol-3-phosphate transport system substrate-binding protein
MERKSSFSMTAVVLALLILVILVVWYPTATKATIVGRAAYEYEPVTVTYWHHNSGAREEYINELLDEFNATNPYSITVVGEYAGGYDEIHDKVIGGLQGRGVLPNVVVAYPNSFADFARYGGVRFLDDYYNDPTIGITEIEDFYPGVVDYYRLGEYGDQLAGLQNGRSIEVMYYNEDLLTGEGLAVPATWDTFSAACAAITTETISGTIVGTDASRFATWLWSRGGELLSEDLNTARFDEQPGIDSLVFFQELINGGYARLPLSDFEEPGALGNGQVGFTFGSSVSIPYYRSAMNDGVNDEWGVTHVPAVPGSEVVDSYGSGQGILHHNETADLASWLFIKWLAEPEQTARWAAVSGYFPVRLSATSHVSMTEKLASDPQYAQAYDLLSLGRSEPGIRGYNAIREIMEGAVVEVLQNDANATITLQAAADEADAILAASGPDSAVITPAGGTLVYSNTQGISATVEFPAGALVVTETVSYVPLDDLPTNGLAFALVPDLVFDLPVTVTVWYRDEDIVGMDEDNLALYNYDWQAYAWIEADPCGGYARNTVDNMLQAVVCHFSDYGLLDWPYRVFLPLITR